MGNRVLHTEYVGVQVGFGDSKPNLAVEADIELVLGHRLQDRPSLVGAWIIGIERHIGGFRGDGNLMHLLPRPFQIKPRLHHAHLRIDVPLQLVLDE